MVSNSDAEEQKEVPCAKQKYLVFKVEDFPVSIWIGSSSAICHVQREERALKHLWLVPVESEISYPKLLEAYSDMLHCLKHASYPIFLYDVDFGEASLLVVYMLMRWYLHMSHYDVIHSLKRQCTRRRHTLYHGDQPIHLLGHNERLLNMVQFLRYKTPEVGPLSLEPHEAVLMSITTKMNCPRHTIQKRQARGPIMCNEKAPQSCCVMGHTHQFSFSKYNPRYWACGSIALYTIQLAMRMPAGLWKDHDLDSIVVNGLWYARYYKDSQEGHATIETQLREMCPLPGLILKDVTDSVANPRMTLQKGLSTLLSSSMSNLKHDLYFILTSISKKGGAGHITAVFRQNEYWYWFEPMECNQGTMRPYDYGSQWTLNNNGRSAFFNHQPVTGCCLRIFDSLPDFSQFAAVELEDRHWSLQWIKPTPFCTIRYELDSEPLTILNPKLYPQPKYHEIYPVFIQQCDISHVWCISKLIVSGQVQPVSKPIPFPFTVTMRPQVKVQARVKLPKGSIIYLGGIQGRDISLSRYEMHKFDQHYGYEPFSNPAIWLTEDGISCMVGYQGMGIMNCIRMVLEDSNIQLIRGEHQDMFLVTTKDIHASQELFMLKWMDDPVVKKHNAKAVSHSDYNSEQGAKKKRKT